MGGPHRADMLVTLDGKPAKELSSKGEEKQMSLTVSFGVSNLIEKKTGALPLLLIDELESGLDEDALIQSQILIRRCRRKHRCRSQK